MGKNKFFFSFFIIVAFFLSGCSSATTKLTSLNQNDVMIHQLRVELEEMKHHIHTTVVQINILTNKIVNSEDTLFELKQRDLIIQKQSLENTQERLSKIEKKMDKLLENQEQKELTLSRLEDDIKIQSKAFHQHKKKLYELEKQTLSLEPPVISEEIN